MSSVAYIVTKDVRHLGAWTQDRREYQLGSRTGAQRPICGGAVRGYQATVWISDYEDPAALARAKRKPVCRLCLKTLTALNEVSS